MIVEDGTGLATANSYVSVVYADAYLDDTWDAYTTAVKEAALIEATEYVDAIYGSRFMGYPLESDQALEFPRAALYDRYGRAVEGVPDDLQKAVSRYAALAGAGDLCTTSSSSAMDAGTIKRKKIKAGAVESDIEYVVGADSALLAACAGDVIADKLLAQYVSTGGGVIRN